MKTKWRVKVSLSDYFQRNIVDALGNLKLDEDFVDVTLSCEGKTIKAHKVILSACSDYFRDVFRVS